MNQPQLPGNNPRRIRKNDDFVGLFPDGVWPTPVTVLEQGQSLLFIKQYEYKQDVTDKQDSIWRLLPRYSEARNADGDLVTPGSIEVCCVWKVTVQHAREVRWYDHTGMRGPLALTTEEFRAMLKDWWLRNGKRR